MSVKSLAKALWRFLYKIQGLVLSFLMFGVTILVFAQVIMRYVLRMPLMGIEELTLFPAIWLYMLGGANASMERKHIECNVLSVYITNPFALRVLDVMKSLISLGVCLWLTYWAYEYFLYSLKVWKTSNLLYIPLFFGESALFICLVLMAFYTVVELGDHLLRFKSYLSGKEEATS
jgi:TRAP-type C4-dicarboxylate transport system permease small subunit